MLRKRTSSFTRPANQQQQQMMSFFPNQQPQQGLLQTKSTTYQSGPENLKQKKTLRLNHLTDSFEIQENKLKKESKVGQLMRKGLEPLVGSVGIRSNCEMCGEDMSQSRGKHVYMCRCDHRNDYCESCLLQYVIYHVKNSQEVFCPKKGCTALLDTSTQFFKHLPIDVQNNYKSLRNFMMTSKEKGIKLCPRYNCNGILRPQGYILLCHNCRTPFCPNCLNLPHQGRCEKYEVKFFQSSIRYQQCRRCQSMIRKEQGKNLLECGKCRAMQCYVCGRPWGPSHEGTHNQFGEVVPSSDGRQIEIEDPYQTSCLKQTLKTIIKVLFLMVFAPLLFVVYVVKDILVLLGMILISLFVGLFGFSFEFIFSLDCQFKVIAILCFPIVMIIGVGIGFKQLFCRLYPKVESGLGDSFWSKLKYIWTM